jgi:hypothetical protein
MFLVYPEDCTELVEVPNPGSRIPVTCTIIEIIDSSTFVIQETVGATGVQHNYTPEAVTPGAPPNTD